MKILDNLNFRTIKGFCFIVLANIAFLCIFQSCKKDKHQEVSSQDAISKAHESFDSESKNSQITYLGNSLLPDSLLKIRKPLWENAYIQSNNDTIVVFVPIEFHNVVLTLNSGGIPGTQLNSLVFLRLINTGKGFSGSKAQMITLLPDQEWKKGEHFSGNMMIENWFKPNQSYVRLSRRPVELVSKDGNKGSGNTVVMGYPTCTEIAITACVVVESFTNCTTTSTVSCMGGGDAGGSGGGNGGGGVGLPNNPGIGGGSGGGNNTPQKDVLKDSLTSKFPCATKLVLNELAKISGYNNMIQPFQQIGLKPTITWNANIQPWVDGNYSGGTTNFSANSGKSASSDINLNINMLQNSSQLLIAAVSIHETYHAYINYMFAFAVSPTLYDKSQPNYMAGLYQYILYTQKGSGDNYVDHYNMLTSQFDNFVSILYTYGKGNYSLDDCRKALLFGMDNAGPNPDFGQVQFINQAYNDILNRYGFTSQQVAAFSISQIHASANKLPTSGCQ